MMFQWYSADGAAVHPLLVVMLALAIDVALGDPPRVYGRIPHPVALFGSLIYEQAMRQLGFAALRISTRGIRFGVLRS